MITTVTTATIDELLAEDGTFRLVEPHDGTGRDAGSPPSDMAVDLQRFGSAAAWAAACGEGVCLKGYVQAGLVQLLEDPGSAPVSVPTGASFEVHPGTTFAIKVKAGSRVVMARTGHERSVGPSELPEDMRSWLDSPILTRRTDFNHDADAPRANSIRPAAAVVIPRGDSVLLVQRGDSGKWSLPGGTLDYGESLEECAVREIREETALEVELVDIVGVYTDPDIRIAYSDGEVRQEFTVVYLGESEDSEVTIDAESTGFRWLPLRDVDGVPMAASQRRRLRDVLEHLGSPGEGSVR